MICGDRAPATLDESLAHVGRVPAVPGSTAPDERVPAPDEQALAPDEQALAPDERAPTTDGRTPSVPDESPPMTPDGPSPRPTPGRTSMSTTPILEDTPSPTPATDSHSVTPTPTPPTVTPGGTSAAPPPATPHLPVVVTPSTPGTSHSFEHNQSYPNFITPSIIEHLNSINGEPRWVSMVRSYLKLESQYRSRVSSHPSSVHSYLTNKYLACGKVIFATTPKGGRSMGTPACHHALSHQCSTVSSRVAYVVG